MPRPNYFCVGSGPHQIHGRLILLSLLGSIYPSSHRRAPCFAAPLNPLEGVHSLPLQSTILNPTEARLRKLIHRPSHINLETSSHLQDINLLDHHHFHLPLISDTTTFKMMQTLFSGHPAGSLPVQYCQDSMFNDFSRQMAMAQGSRKLSKTSTGQRSGTAMRVMKPVSANNSPRSSGGLSRRRTLMNDGNAQRRRQQALEQVSMYYGTEQQLQQPQQPQPTRSRPVSWHPNTYGQQLQPQFQQSAYPISTGAMYAEHQDVYAGYPQLSPMLAAHSCNTSPVSVYSPLALPFQATDTMSYVPSDNSVMAQQMPATMPAPQLMEETYQTPDENVADTMAYANGFDWNTFIMQGFNSTSPLLPRRSPRRSSRSLRCLKSPFPTRHWRTRRKRARSSLVWASTILLTSMMRTLNSTTIDQRCLHFSVRRSDGPNPEARD